MPELKHKNNHTTVKYRTIHRVNPHLLHHHIGIRSRFLNRKVNVDIFLPAYQETPLQVLLLNDGQDAKLLHLEKTLTQRYKDPGLTNMLVAGIHAGDRLYEYGTVGQADYKGRGNKAGEHLSFVVLELIPYLTQEFNILPSGMTYAGFSLGGLSAIDSVWHHPEIFTKAGVFSGSFWWRKKPTNNQYHDSDRIMHARVEKGPLKPGLSFWFEAGTNDEKADRNKNGVIDAIDDTLDLITSLGKIGYSKDQMHYTEIEGGEHNFKTWSAVFPEFLEWAFDHQGNV